MRDECKSFLIERQKLGGTDIPVCAGKTLHLGTDRNVCATFPGNLNRAKSPTLI